MELREVRLSDAAGIAAIYNRYIKETAITFETEPVDVFEMENRIASFAGHALYFVYEIDEKIVGYCYAHAWKTKEAYNCTCETTVYVSHEYKHMGIGSMLMTRLIEECRKSGLHVLIACITEGNESSCRLHEKLGFRRVSHFHEVGFKFGRWLDVEDYELILD